VVDFYRQPVLVSLERLTEGASAGRLATTIVDALATHGGLHKDDLRKKFTSFGADGASVFQVSYTRLMNFIFLMNFRFMYVWVGLMNCIRCMYVQG
jgi:hypothetical protein